MSVVRIESLPDSGNSYRFDGSRLRRSHLVLPSPHETRRGSGPPSPPVRRDVHRPGGQATFTVGDDRIEARAGDVVVAPANVPHAFVNSGQDELRSVNIHPAPEMVTEWL